MASNLIFDVEARGDGAELAVMAAQAEALKEALRELDSTVKAKVELTGASNKDIASIAKLRDALAEIDGKNAKARVDITGVPTAADASALRRTAKALRELDGQNAICRIEVDGELPNPTEIRRAARSLKQLQDVGLIRIHIDVTGAVEAFAQVTALADAIRRLPRRHETAVNVRVDRNSLADVGGIAAAFAKIAASASAASLVLGSAVPAVATLAGSLASLAGLAPVLVGGLAAVGVVVATLKTGLSGFGEAMSSMGDPKAFAAALKDLAPAARETAIAMQGINTAFKSVQLDVQQKLFAGLGAEIKSLGATYLPVLKTGMGGVATELNKTGVEVLKFAQLKSSVADVSAIFDNTKQALAAARPAATNLLAAFKDIAVVGSSMLPGLAQGWTNVTARFRDFISDARQSGQLKEWIQDGVDTLRQLGSIAGNVGSALGSIFTAAKASGADFLSTLDRVTSQVATFLKSSQGQSTLVAFFSDVRAAVDAALPGLATLGAAAASALKAFADTGGLEKVGQALSNVAEKVAPLVEQLGPLVGETLRAMATGAEMAAAGLGPLVGVILDVLGALGPLGPALLGAVVAFKALGPAATALAGLGTKLGAFATSLGASQAAAGRITSAVGAFGRAIPIAGVALVAGGAIVDHFAQQIEDATTALATGAATAQETAAQFSSISLDNIGRSVADTIPLLNLFVDSQVEALQKTEEQAAAAVAAMNPLQLAQRDLTIATREYNDAVKSGNPAAIAAAQQNLAAANDKVAAETKKAADATKNLAEQQRDLQGSTESLIGSMLDLNDAMRRNQEAQTAANDAAKEYGANSKEAQAAADDFVRSSLAVGDAARKQAEAQATANGATDAAAAGNAAYGASLLSIAANAEGPAQQALLGYIGKLNDAQLAALSAGAEATGFATQILTLPDGRTVKIAIDPETGKIVSTQQLLDTLRDKTVVINGDTVPVETALARVLQDISLGKSEVTIDGKTMPAQDALKMFLSQVDISKATVTVDGQSGPADKVLQDYLAAVAAGHEYVTVDGKDVPARDVLNALIRLVTGSNPDVVVGAKDEASADIDYIARNRSLTITVAYKVANALPIVGNVIRPAGGGVMGFAGGGIAAPIHARSGYVLPGYAPGKDTIPAVLSKGEAVLVPELVRMLGARRILDANAEASGGRRPAITGSIASMMDGVISGSAKTAATATSGVVRTAVMTASGRRGGGELAAAMAAVATLRSELATQTQVMRDQVAAIASARPVTVMAQPGNELAAGRGVRLAMRLA